MRKRTIEPIYEEEEIIPEEEIRESIPKREVVSTSQAVNLTCTFGALSSLFALFLYFNDERSKAVRRLSVQSVALGCGYVLLGLFLLFISLTFGTIPIIGMVIDLILSVSFASASVIVIYLKIRMMQSAYKGYAYLLPLCGQWLRRFE